MSIGLGLAGLGVHGQRYADHLLRGDVPGARLVAISRADRKLGQAMAERHDLSFVADPCELASCAGVDAVVLCLPPDLHSAAARACLSAGRPVLVEKPLGADRRQAAEIVRTVEETGGFCLVAHTLRWDPLIEAIRRESEQLGELCLISINQRGEPWQSGWSDDVQRGGVVRITGVHGFDLLRYLSGLEVSEVSAYASRVRGRKTEDQFTATVRFADSEVLGLIDNARTTESRTGRIEWVGRDGQVWGDHIHRDLVRIHQRNSTALGPIPERHTLPAVLDSFVESLRTETAPKVSAADGLAAVEMVDAARRSIELGRPVRMAELRG